MRTFLTITMFAAMLGTLGVLFAGMFGFARGSDPRGGNVLMRWRVALQGVAILSMMSLLALSRH